MKSAEAALTEAQVGQPTSVVAQAQSDVNAANRAVDGAIAKQASDAVNVQVQLDNARAAYARLVNDPAADPDDVDAARLAVTEGEANVSIVSRADADAVASAQEAMYVATLKLGEAKKLGDPTAAEAAVRTAMSARDSAAASIATLVAINGPTIPQGEIVFMPTMPARVQSAVSSLGSLTQDGGAPSSDNGPSLPINTLVSLAGGPLIVTSSIRSSEAGLTRVGMPAELLDETTTSSYSAKITSLADQPTVSADGQLGFSLTGAAPGSGVTPRPTSIPGTGLVVPVSNAYTNDGCLGKADQTVSGDRYLILALRDNFNIVESEADSRAAADATFRRVLAQWSKCFTQEGYSASYPLEAIDNYYASGDKADGNEIRVALADVGCKQSVNLTSEWEASLQRALADTDPPRTEAVSLWVSFKAQMVERAKKILS